MRLIWFLCDIDGFLYGCIMWFNVYYVLNSGIMEHVPRVSRNKHIAGMSWKGCSIG